jgi:ACS family tartrate transporter-like MFS transporter
MNKAIGLDAYTYGLGAGIFFVGYFIFEVPSNLILARVGARRWIARILFTWGLVATGMAWVQGTNSFLIMRFLLGVAEAGFFPGVILYLTYWFPARYRARIISRFMLAIPLSLAVGAPISTWIMQLDGTWGFAGWQWLFLLEGLPAVVLPVAVWLLLPDGPRDASWLNDEEKAWIERELASDRETVAVAKSESRIMGVFTNPMVWAFSFIYFVSTTTNYGLSLFMPQIIKQLGFSTMQTGFIMFVPYIIGCAGMLVIGQLSDRNKERKWHLIVSLLMIAAGLGAAGWLGNTVAAIGAMCFAAIGIMGCKGPFWPLPSAYLHGAGAAAGIALINSVGNLGGFAGPWAVGLAKQVTGSFSSGLYALAAVGLAGALLTFFVVKVKKGADAGADQAAGGQPPQEA